MTIFFTSDTHFSDPRILKMPKRPFATLAEHDRALIDNWNRTVGPEDEIWHLGDFILERHAERVTELLACLNGVKRLVIGNNDPPATIESPGWASVQHYAELRVDARHCILCHYPFRTWNQIGKGSIDLHGHSHGQLKELTRQYDVGVDVWNYRPVPLETILASRRKGKVSENS
jgi:calcineurin-like phosphoesterase family protein